MNDKVYIITKGDYSDYHICAVTLDEERAEKLRKMYSDSINDANIEEYVPNEAKPIFLYGVQFSRDGNVMSYRADEYDLKDEGYVEYEYDGYEQYYVVWVKAKDEDHALKIAQDRLAEYKAKEAGIV